MTVTEAREDLLTTYGRFYGEQHFAVAFTAGTEGSDAKKVATRGWDKTAPLADGDYGASYISGRGRTKNPAIVLRPSNLIVLECDTEEDLVRIESLDLPATVTVRSSEPYKRHLWFRPAPELDSLPYVAFRFESGKLTADAGRYFLAPPSIHPSGAVYAFLPEHGPHELAIATLDAGIYNTLASNAHVEDDQQRESIELDPSARFRAGSRRDALFRYACMLRRWGLSHTEILEQTLRYNDSKCDPPVERQYVEVQVDGATKKRGGQEFSRPETAPHPADSYELPTEEEKHDSWLPIDLNTLPAKPPVPPTLGGIGIVYPGKRHVFSGPQESAKTIAAYAIGIEVVRQGGTIVLIDFEMGSYDARGRLHELGATRDDISRIRYLEPDEPATPERIGRLLIFAPDLVIVDAAAGAYDLQGLDDNKRQDVERIARLYVRSFWKAGIATIFIDHVVKDTESRGKYAIGSERKVGGADVHLGFETITPIKRGSSGLYKIVTHKDRGGFLERGRLADLHLTSDPQSHTITWQFKPAGHEPGDRPQLPTVLMERVSRYLEEQSESVTRNQIVINIKGNAEFVRAAIDHLCGLHYVAETSGSNRARLYSSTQAFRRSEWESKEETQVRPGSSEVRPDEQESGSSDRPPPYGEADEPTRPEDQPVRLQKPDEPELDDEDRRLLALYVTEPHPSSWIDDLTPDDLHDDPNDDIPF